MIKLRLGHNYSNFLNHLFKVEMEASDQGPHTSHKGPMTSNQRVNYGYRF